jgi:hypothetical protein
MVVHSEKRVQDPTKPNPPFAFIPYFIHTASLSCVGRQPELQHSCDHVMVTVDHNATNFDSSKLGHVLPER